MHQAPRGISEQASPDMDASRDWYCTRGNGVVGCSLFVGSKHWGSLLNWEAWGGVHSRVTTQGDKGIPMFIAGSRSVIQRV